MGELLDDDLLEDRLCLMLYRASHAMTAAYRKVLEPFDLTYPQYTIVSALGRTDAVTIKRLGDLLDSNYGTMSPLIRRLETKGLVRRVRGTSDEREVFVQLTDQGRLLHTRTEDVQVSIRTAGGLSNSRLDRLVDDLQHLATQLRTFNN